jgi:cephalosporin-C deacetylase-like acetyl esterase
LFLLVTIGLGSAGPQPSLAGDAPPIKQAATLPATTPWDLAALSKPPEFEWREGKEVRSLFYKGEPYQGKPTRVFAYYASPGSLAGDPWLDKDLPGIVLVHGGGGTAFPEWAKLWASRGYAAIAMDLGIRGPAEEKFLADGGPRPKDSVKFATGQPATDQWTYHAVADVIRAHSLLLSFDEVDPARTALTGISWGGYLTCIVAGLDDRFKAAVPVYGCGFLHENSVWFKTLESMSPKDRETWVRLWDPSMYVGSATMPMLFANGGTDFAYPPDSHAKTYALVTSPKQLHFVPHLPHGHYFDKPEAVRVFIDHHLKGGMPLPSIGRVQVGGKQLVAPVTTATKLLKAELHFTVESLRADSPARKWTSQPAMIENGSIRSDLPPAEATAWFLTVADERNATVSSPLAFPGSAEGRARTGPARKQRPSIEQDGSTLYFDPVSGRRHDLGVHKLSGDWKSPNVPSPQDWVLVMEKTHHQEPLDLAGRHRGRGRDRFTGRTRTEDRLTDSGRQRGRGGRPGHDRQAICRRAPAAGAGVRELVWEIS